MIYVNVLSQISLLLERRKPNLQTPPYNLMPLANIFKALIKAIIPHSTILVLLMGWLLFKFLLATY